VDYQREKNFRKDFPLIMEVPIREFLVDYKSSSVACRGVLYVTDQHLCFVSKIFALQIKSVLSYWNIVKYEVSSSLVVNITKKNKNPSLIQYTMKNESDVSDFTVLLEKHYKSSSQHLQLTKLQHNDKLQRQGSATFEMEQLMKLDQMSKSTFEVQMMDFDALQDDWKTILKSAECLRFKKGEKILTEGDKYEALFQVTHGKCVVHKKINGENNYQVIGTIKNGEIFGEIDFLEREGASADVIADCHEVEVWKVKRSSLNVHFGMNPELAVRFFKYLAIVTEKRLHDREIQLLDEINDDNNNNINNIEKVEQCKKPYENPFEDDD